VRARKGAHTRVSARARVPERDQQERAKDNQGVPSRAREGGRERGREEKRMKERERKRKRETKGVGWVGAVEWGGGAQS
jgi:hypothetical protein